MANLNNAINALNALTDWCMAEEQVTDIDSLSFDVRNELTNISYYITLGGVGVEDAIESANYSIKSYEEDGYEWETTFYKKILNVLEQLK